MAFVVSKPNGTWEARESHRTPDGPRSRTLATFSELTPEVVEKIRQRSSAPLDPDDLRRRSLRAGAPVMEVASDRAAADLLRETYMNRPPRPGLQRLLADSFASPGEPLSHEAERMKLWSGASTTDRADALVELLDLGDRLPAPRRSEGVRFPRIRSA